MGQRYLADSNVIIDHTAGLLPAASGDFLEDVFNKEFLVSVIVKIEVLGFDHVVTKLEAMERFLNSGIDLPLDESITNECILLRRRHKKLKLPDAIIAATAKVHSLILLTNNAKDFANIKRLKVLNPYDL